MDLEINKSKTVCFSGHRIEKLPYSGDKDALEVQQIKECLKQAILEAVEAGYTHFICDIADGWDKWAFETVVAIRDWKGEKITLEVAIPYRKVFKGREKLIYEAELSYVDKVTILSEVYHRGVYHKRNKYVVENSSLLICYFNGSPGGTKFTVEQAVKNGLQIKNIYDNNLEETAMTDDEYAICIYRAVFKTQHVGDDAIISGIHTVLTALCENEKAALESHYRFGRSLQQVGHDLGGISSRIARGYIDNALIKLRHPSCLRKMSKLQAGKHDDELRRSFATLKITMEKICEALLLNGVNAEMKLLAAFDAAGLRLSDLELSSQCVSALGRDGKNSVHAIYDIASYNDLIDIKGIGIKAAEEIIIKMRDLGFVEWAYKIDNGRKELIE